MSDTILEQWVLALAPGVLQYALSEEWHKDYPEDWRERVGQETWELARIIKEAGRKDY